MRALAGRAEDLRRGIEQTGLPREEAVRLFRSARRRAVLCEIERAADGTWTVVPTEVTREDGRPA